MAVSILPTPSVRIDQDRVVFDGFVEKDRHVFEAIASAADPEACAHELLHLGARLSGLAAGTGGLAELEARVGTRLDTLGDHLAEQARELFSAEDGEVTTALHAWREALDRHLAEIFDPEHKKSVIAAIERSLDTVLEAYSRRLTAATDPDLPDSLAGRILSQVRENATELKSEIATLTLAVGADKGRSAEYARSAVKGLEYEPLVLEVLSGIAAPHGDVVEHVARKSGPKGTKRGDILVTLCDEDVPGETGRYVIEVKDRRLTMGAIWHELDDAMANWEAQAAIAVFAGGHLAPTDLPFWYSGERAIVVLDREDPDPAPLALACLFARWVVRRRCVPEGKAPDPEKVATIIERIQRALAKVTPIRRSLSTSAKATGEAREQVDDLVADIREALGELAAEIER